MFPLHSYVVRDDLDMVEYLLARGDDPHSKDPNGALPTHLAASLGALRLEVMNVLYVGESGG